MAENGDGPKVDTVVLTLQRDPWQLTIGGQVENINLALAIVTEAQRTLETEWRIGAAISAQEQHKSRKHEEERIRNILDIGSRIKQ